MPTLPTLAVRTAEGSPDDAVTALAAGLAVAAALVLLPGLVLTWLAATGTLVGVRARALERVAARLTPALVRRALAAGLGAGLGLGLVAPATASDIDLGWDPTTATAEVGRTPHAPGGADTAGGAVAPVVDAPGAPPTATDGRQPTDPATAPTLVDDPRRTPPVPDAQAPRTVVVEPGDTLWDIAARALVEPTTGEIAAAWPRWWDANRDVIDDPDLIRPGQELRAPAPLVHAPVPPKEQP